MSTQHDPKLILGFYYWELDPEQQAKYNHDWLEESKFYYITDSDGDIVCIGHSISNISPASNLEVTLAGEINSIRDEFGIYPYIFAAICTY